MGAIGRFIALEAREKRLVLRAGAAVASAVWRLRLSGVRRALAWADAPLGRPAGGGAADLVVAVHRAARYVPGGSCLPRSLALARLLRKAGVAASVRLGVATGAEFAAHAWVEVDAMPIGDAPSRFTALPRRR